MSRTAALLLLALLALPAAVATPARAQFVPPPPRGSPLPPAAPGALPPAEEGTLPRSPRRAEAEAPAGSVAVAEVQAQGVTVYGVDALNRLAAGLVGPEVPLARIEAARRALLDRYRADGFFLADVWAEVTPGGALRFVVAEGRIADVLFEGEVGPVAAQLRRFLSRIPSAEPATEARLERWLLLAQDVPGVALETELRPIGDASAGDFALVVRARREGVVSGALSLDNRSANALGPQQAVLQMAVGGLTPFGERTEVALLRGFPSEQRFGQAAVEMFLGGSGLRLRLQGGAGESWPLPAALRAFRWLDRSTVVSGTLIHPLVRRRDRGVVLSLALDATETETSVGFDGFGRFRLAFDSVRAVRAGLDAARRDDWLGEARPGVTALQLRLAQGLPALGASRADSIWTARPGGRPDFLKLTGELSREQTLFAPQGGMFDGARLGLFLAVAGQASRDRLPVVERFYLGGARFNRGFFLGEVTGDEAVTGSVELRLDHSLATGLTAARWERAGLRWYAFHDRGQAFDNRVPGLSGRRLASAGSGLRVAFERGVEVQVEGVARLTRRPQPEVFGGPPPLPAGAVYWRLAARF